MAVKKKARAKTSAARASAKAPVAKPSVAKPHAPTPEAAMAHAAAPPEAPEAMPHAPMPIEDAAPAQARTRVGWTRMAGAGLAFIVIATLAGVGMFKGNDSGERAEASAIAAPSEAPAAQPQPAKPVRVIAGVPRKKTLSMPRSAESSGSSPAAAPAAPKTASELPDAVMIEGCLEQTGQSFRLKDTSGEGAPKSRSWKSGFLKKATRPVDVVDWNNRLKDHVGERVTVSGMFVDGEMRVRSLRRVASCN